MDLLASLGVNSSLFVQFGLFVVVYLCLKHVLFTPYAAAYRARSERTVGQADRAEKLVEESRALEARFKESSRRANVAYREIFEAGGKAARQAYDAHLNKARDEARTLVESNQSQIRAQIDSARQALRGDVASISDLIRDKLVGTDARA